MNIKLWIQNNKTYVLDVVERAAWTFVEAFAAVWGLPVIAEILNGGTLSTVWQHVADTSVLDKATVGGLAALIAFAKSIIAKRVGNRNTAALLPYDPEV